MKTNIKNRFYCLDCSFDTNTNDEYYMVHDHVWKKAGDIDGMLCIGCLEKRLDRKLNKLDFSPYPINTCFSQSDRLRNRIQR